MSEDWKEKDLLLRQVHPNHRTGDAPNSQAFHPTPKDDGRLSVDDARLASPEESFRHFTEDLGFASSGTWAVSIGEVRSQENLEVEFDPVEGEEESERNNPAHTVIDFNSVDSKRQIKKRAQALAILATARGCLYDPTS